MPPSGSEIKIISVKASNSYKSDFPKNVIDGNLNTRWASSASKPYIILGLEKITQIDAIQIYWHGSPTRQTYFDLLVSTSGLEADYQFILKNSQSAKKSVQDSRSINKKAKFIKIIGHGNNEAGSEEWTGISEIRLISASTSCSPKTCESLGASCGTISDGCGARLKCGTCDSPDTCSDGTRSKANMCVAPDDSDDQNLDEDGVTRLFPALASGTNFRLGSMNPNSMTTLVLERSEKAVAQRENHFPFWSVPGFDVNYSSGGKGKTTRFLIHANGGNKSNTGILNWKTQKNGFRYQNNDLKNQEFTVYMRLRGLMDSNKAAISMKVRGGNHSEDKPENASCVMMTFGPSGRNNARFGKELNHPNYEYKSARILNPVNLVENKWYGIKMISHEKENMH